MLAIAFTRKAAQEMRTRLTHMLGLEADELNVPTFHALGLEMVKANLDYFGYTEDGLSVFDAQRSKTLLRRVMRELELSEEQYPLEEIHQAIVRAKERLQGPPEGQKRLGEVCEERIRTCGDKATRVMVSKYDPYMVTGKGLWLHGAS